MATPFPTQATTFGELAGSLRRHTLAGDQRAGSWARGMARSRWLYYVKRRRAFLLVMAGSAAVLITLLTFAVPNTFVRGLIVGGGTIGAGALIADMIGQVTGTAHLRGGADAERLTATALRPLLQHGWRLINHMSLKFYDIDHVLVGPAGMLVVETKWSANPWRLDAPNERVTRAISHARRNAGDLARWHAVKNAGIEQVWTTVFLWSAMTPETEFMPTSLEWLANSYVVPGRTAAAEWRQKLMTAPERLTPAQVDALYTRIDDHLRTRDAKDAERTPVPASLSRAYWTVAASGTMFMAGLLIGIYGYTLTGSVVGGLAVALVAAGAALPHYARRIPRAIRGSWFAGLGVVSLLALAHIVWPYVA